MKQPIKILMSGGGTGGHIFPALAIAQEIRQRFPQAEFLFIGATGKMEMQKVPQAGFNIVGLPIAGFNRAHMLRNLTLPFKLLGSLVKAHKTIRDFKPDVAIGTGGFASGPALYTAAALGIPVFVQEQNSLPGKTNIFLSGKAKAVFTAYPNMEKFFPKTRTVFTGNPVRQQLTQPLPETQTAREKMGLNPDRLTVLSVGGSLGSQTLNNAWKSHLQELEKHQLQLIWQTGSTAFSQMKEAAQRSGNPDIHVHEFISDMASAYAAADIIVSRAGAIAISELALVKKPVLLVPFPFAAEDHQTKNAQALVEKNAARMVTDAEVPQKFWNVLQEICYDDTLRQEMSANIAAFARPDATSAIVDEILNTLNKNE